ncbi:carbohydrate ABC transporter permease [Harryflintia acetispora]|uniref:carbohydrate ABC transporter permease n=1 Tax=Harryflintia acetispora TaxID=1849041 RepID=UPI00256FEDBE|nr:sugar ABC transporter permease [Harryflintia acetispora]
MNSTTAAPKRSAPQRIARYMRREAPYLVMILPAFLFFFLFVLLPLIEGIPISFTEWDGFSDVRPFVGFQNYTKLFHDKFVYNAVGNTLEFTIYEVVLCNVLGLLIAVWLKKACAHNNLFRTLIFMPHVISLLLSSYMVRYIFNEFYNVTGVVNILAVPKTVIIGLALIAIWRDTGYCMVIYLAAIQGVDESLYEVARIEGAGRITQFFKITVPMIMPAITANVTLLTAWGLKLYDYPMAATGGGGPGRASESVNIYIYNNIFPYFKAGYGQALAIVWVIVIFIITQCIQGYLRRKEVEL